jgi:hypothetical protein
MLAVKNHRRVFSTKYVIKTAPPQKAGLPGLV